MGYGSKERDLAAHYVGSILFYFIGSFLEIQARHDEGLTQRLDNEDGTICII